MNKITVVHISDIHFEKNEPENQGLIINSFFKDLEPKINSLNRDNTYCIISGDLVNRGNSDKIFNDFYDNFIKKLSKEIPIKNIFCSPGNHDLNRTIVEDHFDEHQEILGKTFTESEFNEFIKTENNLILRKFSHYETFVKNKLDIPKFNSYGYSELFIPEITVYFLNCALLSCGGYKEINDKGNLKIETSELNKWIQENDGRTKVLVMHHPIDYLTKFAQGQLKSMLKGGIDILISGHIHEQELDHNYITEDHGLIRLGSPQLYSDKKDLNGYSILTFQGNQLECVEYRQWSSRFRKFMAGQDFSGTETGIRKFTQAKIVANDIIRDKLLLNFQKAMKAYSQEPKWVERTLSNLSPNSSKKDNEEKLDYLNIINQPVNYQIIASPQFGLTCYAHYLALKAWEVKKHNWLYFDCANWNFSNSIKNAEESLSDFQIAATDVKCILLDNWKNALKDAHKILEKLKKIFPNTSIIILSNYHDSIIIEGLDSEESHEGFKQIYLCPLSRKGLRNIVQNFNNAFQIADENRVLERLDIDLVDLNIHRTPLNCLQLLIAFLNSFEDRPINRSKVFSYILKVIFDNPGNLFYGNTLDEGNCTFILGYFSQYLLENNKEEFSEAEFLSKCSSFAETNYNTTNVADLLQVLKNNQILVNYNGALKFRFIYWIYFFAAGRMKISDEFAEFMFKKKHSLYYPEIIEFYTGTDGARENVVKMLINDLESLTTKVHTQIGLREDLNPFAEIKWSLNERVSGMTQQQLEESVQKSKLPDEIKDVVADKNYDSIKPYTQTINTFFEDFDVKNLMELTRSASRALRNSEFVSAELKDELIQKIFNAWKEIIRVLFLVAPVMAKNGFGGVGGARFELSDGFPKEYSECLKNIVTVMPYNVMQWYKDDIFSDKLRLLLRKYMEKYPDEIVQHIIALLECYAKPNGWKKSIEHYIGRIGKNSYFLGSLYINLRSNYATQFMLHTEEKDTAYLIKSCWVKHHTGSPSPGKGSIAKVPKDTLPLRKINEID